MFTGFASENTPAIQVHDFFRPFASTTAIRSVTLADDCAPIQVFRTGATGSSVIRVYLPTSPIEGKQITIVNQQYGSISQDIQLFSSDVSGTGSLGAFGIYGQSSFIVLVYSKQAISFGTNNGATQTGWIILNQGSPSAASVGSAIVGGDGNRISNQYGFVGGGASNVVTSAYGAVVGGSNGSASGAYSFVAGGQSNTASGSNSAVVGCTSSTANASTSAVIGGSSNTASGNSAAVIGGTNNGADGASSIVIGGAQGTTRGVVGSFVTPASNVPITNAIGRTQATTLLLGRQTTDATATVLASNTSAAGTVNQVILANNSAYAFQGTCIANVTAGGTTSGWKFEGVIKRGATAASTALVAAVTPTVIAQDAGAAAWVLAVTADTTNGGIAVTVTGAAATTIRWVAKIETTEVAF